MASSYVRSLDSMPATYTPLADSTQLLLNTPTPAPIMQMDRPATLSPSSSSNAEPVELSIPTALLVSLTAVLGVAVVAIAAVLCWMRQWKHAQRPRAPLTHRRGQPGTHCVRAGLGHPAGIMKLTTVKKPTRPGLNTPPPSPPIPSPRRASAASATMLRLWSLKVSPVRRCTRSPPLAQKEE